MTRVAVARLTEARYPSDPPYHPGKNYPEYPFAGQLSADENHVYDGVRSVFFELGYDREHWGTSRWNPLGCLIEPGMTVVLKPNFVLSRHGQGKDLFSIITHPSVLRALLDYSWIALRGTGRIVIADAPQYDCNFAELVRAAGLDKVVDFYGDVPGPVVDLRDLRRYWSPSRHFQSLLLPLAGDPLGSVTVNLGKHSALYGIAHPEKLYGAVYHRNETIAHHTGERQEYEVSRTVLDADVVISVPKLKVHKKVGVTLNIKGLVGTATNKNLLVHYSLTTPDRGGDQFPVGLLNPLEAALIGIERWMYDNLLARRNRPLEYLHRTIYAIHNRTTRRLGLKVDETKRQMDAGNWHGNDSAWRMAVDLFKVFCFADREGRLQTTPQRRMFSLIDGVTGGENNGPLLPDPVASGILLGGTNFLAVDLVATRLMGFDGLKLRTFQSLLGDQTFDFGLRSLREIEVRCADLAWARCLTDKESPFLGFRPHPGWLGHAEIRPRQRVGVARGIGGAQ